MKIRYVAFLVLFNFIRIFSQIIYETNGGHIGDHLISLYNAYILAKKYNLELALSPFPHYELFECYNVVPHYSHIGCKIIEVHNEHDIINHLNQKDVNFHVNILTDRPMSDIITALEAKQIIMLNKNINLDYLAKSKDNNIITIAVHIRKGNDGNADGFVGGLVSQQIFDFDRSRVQYIHEPNTAPLGHFNPREMKSHNSMHGNEITRNDRHWPAKFAPEQFYIDQLKRVIHAKKGMNIVVKLFTDDIDPRALISRIESQLANYNIKIEYHDNKGKDQNTRIVEDLYLMTQCDILIRSKSGFSIVADIIGDFKTVIFPIDHRWDGNKLIMTRIVIKGEYI